MSIDRRSIFSVRRARLQKKLSENRINAVILINSRDVFYYTGMAVPSVTLLTPSNFHLYILRGWSFAKERLLLDHQFASEGNPEDAVAKLKYWGVNSGAIGFEMDTVAVKTFFRWQKMLPHSEFINISHIILEQRKIKDEMEIAFLRKACQISDTGHNWIRKVLRGGMTEVELSREIECAQRQAGDEGTTFTRTPGFFMSRLVVASGPNLYKWSGVAYTITGRGLSPALPIGPSHRKIGKGDIVIVDLGPSFNGYHSDQSRTYIVGKPDSELSDLFCALRDISDHIMLNLRDGVKCNVLYHLALKRAKELNLDEYFLNLGGNNRSRLVGHGMGLELNEPPFLAGEDNTIIRKGCVISIEAHIMHPKGVVKLEDDVLVRRHGAEIITLSPRELVEVEP
jgi:Xaa-Pro aminopeptidase